MKEASLPASLPRMRVRRPAEVRSFGKVEFLRRPSTYPGEGRRVHVIETHFAWVFLTGSHAYKMKKSMRQQSMDYRTLAARERGCRDEIRLNRRLAPSVYLGVVPLARKRNGALVLGHGGRVVDWVVRMRRLPAARMLDRVIVTSSVTRQERSALIRLLAEFYRQAARKPMSPRAYVAHVRARTLANYRELLARDLSLNVQVVEQVIQAQLAFIARGAALLRSRGRRLVEGHGDLRPEHVYLGSKRETLCVIDCLEFDARLRRLDPAEETAFLGLECIRLGAGDLAHDLLRGVRQAMEDPVPAALVHFYMSQRAVTRAKIAAWHLRDPQFASRARYWKKRACDYLADALYCSRAALGASEPGGLSILERHRPALQKWRDRPSREYAPQGLAE